MREYLFRGKMIANGKWSEGNLLVTKQGCCITPDATVLGSYGAVDLETVGQYTGYKDKNGKKIFEGDICSYKQHKCILPILKIIWDDGWVAIGHNDYLNVDDFLDSSFEKYGEVIGNIYDNPELLKLGEINE